MNNKRYTIYGNSDDLEGVQEVIDLVKENERLKEDNKELSRLYSRANNEFLRLHSIIKEVREYIMSELITEWDIKTNGYVSGSDLPVDAITPILEILDKENK